VLARFACEVLEAAGADRDEAESVARILVWGDAVGLPNQGLWRLDTTVRRLEDGGIRSPCRLSMETVFPGCLRIDGNDGPGHYVAEVAIDEAIELARARGLAFVGVRNGNFCGALGYYVDRAARQDCVAFAFSNSFPKVVPAGGSIPALGTNPIAIGAPATGGETFVLDMSTAASAGSTITKLAEQGGELPPGVALGAEGQPTLDPEAAARGALLPFGGAKGFGLALVVEIVGGILSEAAVSREVESMYHFDAPGRNGQAFIVLNTGHFLTRERYTSRFDALRNYVVEDQDVRLPGERRSAALADAERNGVYLEPSTQAKLSNLARGLRISHPFPDA
jgi:(2R)-3-sulfolactate dehydrogenase (NADP+)